MVSRCPAYCGKQVVYILTEKREIAGKACFIGAIWHSLFIAAFI
jgi:hypothetical protein